MSVSKISQNITIDHFLARFQGSREEKVVLYVFKHKTAQLKLIDLSQVKTWKAAADDLVPVVVKSDGIATAFVSDKVRAALTQIATDLSIDGQLVTVEALNAEEAEELAHINQLFADYIEDQQEEQTKQLLNAEHRSHQQFAHFLEYNGAAERTVRRHTISLFLLKMANIPEQIKIRFLQRMGEVQRMIAARNKEIHQEEREEKRRLLQRRIEEKTIENNTLSYHQQQHTLKRQKI